MLYSMKLKRVFSQRHDCNYGNIKDLSFLVLIRTIQEFSPQWNSKTEETKMIQPLEALFF